MKLLSRETAAFMQELRLRHERCFKIGEALLRGCERHEVPEEALDRLIGPEGGETMDAITLLIEADHRSPSVPRFEKRLIQPVSQIESPSEIFLVPDMDAVAITALAKNRCWLTCLDGKYEKWDYLVGLDGKPISGRGKRFEVLFWEPDRKVSSDDVREYFQEKGGSRSHSCFHRLGRAA